MLSSPNFTHDMFPGRNIDTTFFALLEGLKNIRSKVGGECYEKLVEMTAAMRGHFEEDEVREGNIIADDISELIKEACRAKRRSRAAND